MCLFTLLLEVLVCESGDYLVRFLRAHCHHSEIILDWVFFDLGEHIIDLDSIVVVNEHTAHEPSCLLVDVDADVFGGAVLVEGLFDVLIGEVAVDVLDI